MTFGERLMTTRERYGWSAMVLAKRTGVPYETIYRVEHGIHRAPSLDVMIKLAQGLGVSIDYLAGLTDVPQPGERTPMTRRRQRETRTGEQPSHA